MAKKSKRNGLIIILLAMAYLINQYAPQLGFKSRPVQSVTTIQQAVDAHQSDLQIEITAPVIKVLRDDTQGSRHQRFLIQLPSNDTILVAHNIDLAPRIDNLKAGVSISVYGEYEWNKKGGVIHWTHRDPANRHTHGWIKYQGKTYQ